jgi:hypothetical protein
MNWLKTKLLNGYSNMCRVRIKLDPADIVANILIFGAHRVYKTPDPLSEAEQYCEYFKERLFQEYMRTHAQGQLDDERQVVEGVGFDIHYPGREANPGIIDGEVVHNKT